ncbi:MAG: hypothetical protein ACKOW9_06565 [Candidatus Paceibacterota bacterium]
MGRNIIHEVLASARALDSCLNDKSLQIRVVEDEFGLYHAQPMDPLVSILLSGAGNDHLSNIGKAKSRVYTINKIESEKLCGECFVTSENLIECINDWDLLGSLKSFHSFNRLSRLKLKDLNFLNEGVDEVRFNILVESFLLFYGMYSETEIDYNYIPSDGRSITDVLDNEVSRARESLEVLHASMLRSKVVLEYLERDISENDKESVCVLLDPLISSSFWGSKPNPDDETWVRRNEVKKLIAVYCYRGISSEVVAYIPKWVHKKIEVSFPELLLSEAYHVDNIAVFETAKKLYDESDGSLFSSFDECVRSAAYLER